MKRTDVIQGIIDKKKARAYLEIGVFNGSNFFPIKARRKVAVDPSFAFSPMRKLKWTVRNMSNWTARYHQVTSDDFFARGKGGGRFDVAFIDGLHTYEQSLKDVLNALDSLNDDGVIVMHDCNPPHEAAAQPAASREHMADLNLPGWTGEWNGDVWKTVCYLRSRRKDLRVFVLDCDYGLGIVTKGAPDACLNLSEDALNNMTYNDLARDRRNLLNLKDESYFYEFLKTL